MYSYSSAPYSNDDGTTDLVYRFLNTIVLFLQKRPGEVLRNALCLREIPASMQKAFKVYNWGLRLQLRNRLLMKELKRLWEERRRVERTMGVEKGVVKVVLDEGGRWLGEGSVGGSEAADRCGLGLNTSFT